MEGGAGGQSTDDPRENEFEKLIDTTTRFPEIRVRS